MNYLALASVVVLVTAQSIWKQKYNDRYDKGVFFFSMMGVLVAALFFVGMNLIGDRDWSFESGILPNAIGFSASYAAASLFTVLALKNGSLAKTSLFISYSLLIPAVYGMIFLHEPISVCMVIGIVLLIVSVFCTNYQPPKSEEKISVRWVIYVTLATVGNGMCSTFQKMHTTAYPGRYGNIFMIVALSITVAALLLISVFSEKGTVMAHSFRAGWLFALLIGLANGAVNALVMYLNPRLPSSVLFPVISAGGIVLAFLYSVLICREKFGKLQLTGFVVGVASVVLMNF